MVVYGSVYGSVWQCMVYGSVWCSGMVGAAPPRPAAGPLASVSPLTRPLATAAVAHRQWCLLLPAGSRLHFTIRMRYVHPSNPLHILSFERLLV